MPSPLLTFGRYWSLTGGFILLSWFVTDRAAWGLFADLQYQVFDRYVAVAQAVLPVFAVGSSMFLTGGVGYTLRSIIGRGTAAPGGTPRLAHSVSWIGPGVVLGGNVTIGTWFAEYALLATSLAHTTTISEASWMLDMYKRTFVPVLGLGVFLAAAGSLLFLWVRQRRATSPIIDWERPPRTLPAGLESTRKDLVQEPERGVDKPTLSRGPQRHWVLQGKRIRSVGHLLILTGSFAILVWVGLLRFQVGNSTVDFECRPGSYCQYGRHIIDFGSFDLFVQSMLLVLTLLIAVVCVGSAIALTVEARRRKQMERSPQPLDTR